MDIEMVFNELCLQKPATDIYEARKWMTNFIRTLATATNKGIKRILRTDANYYSYQIAPNYSFANWLSDKKADLEEKRFFRTISTKAPFLVDLNGSKYKEYALSSEFFYDNKKAEGLGVSFLLEALCISLLSDNRWDSHEINLKMKWLYENGKIEEDEILVKHASKKSHIGEHINWILERQSDNLKNGKDLWERKGDYFSSLIFCETISARLLSLGENSPHFKQIKNKLFELEHYCTEWTEGAFDPDNLPFNVTLESQATLKKYGEERTFTCPDAVKRTFSWHARITPSEWRLYLYPLENINKLIIGYLGPHLTIVSQK